MVDRAGMLRQLRGVTIRTGHQFRHRPAVVRAVAQATAPRIYKYKDIGAWTSEMEESRWHGFIGDWLGPMEQPGATTSMRGLRSFRWHDSTRRQLDQINVYCGGRPGLPSRASDGLQQLDLTYTDKRVDALAREEAVSTERGSIVAADASAFANLSRFWLPPVALAAAGAAGEGAREVPAAVLAAAKAAEEDDATNRHPVRSANWGMEVFLRDGDCRWSFPIVYDAGSGALTRTAFIREYATTADPTSPRVLEANRAVVLEPRQQLPEEPASWLLTPGSAPTHGSPMVVAGRRVARVWTAPGNQHLLIDDDLGERVEWDSTGAAAATGDGAEMLLIRLPDSMYMRVPKTIAASSGGGGGADGSGSGSGGGSPLRFEVGGLMRSAGGSPGGGGVTLARIVVQYDRVTGAFVDLYREVFSAPSPAD